MYLSQREKSIVFAQLEMVCGMVVNIVIAFRYYCVKNPKKKGKNKRKTGNQEIHNIFYFFHDEFQFLFWKFFIGITTARKKYCDLFWYIKIFF